MVGQRPTCTHLQVCLKAYDVGVGSLVLGSSERAIAAAMAPGLVLAGVFFSYFQDVVRGSSYQPNWEWHVDILKGE